MNLIFAATGIGSDNPWNSEQLANALQLATILGQALGAVATLWACYIAVRKWGETVLKSMALATSLTVVAGTLFVGWAGTRLFNSTVFDSKVGDYIMQAFKTNDRVKANKYLSAALDYLEKSGRNKGYSAIFVGGQADDLEEWVDDLRLAYNDTGHQVAYMMPAADELIVSTVKVEPIQDAQPWKTRLQSLGLVRVEKDGEGKVSEAIQCPSGISVAPYNFHFFAWLMASIGLSGLGLTWMRYARHHKAPCVCDYCKRHHKALCVCDYCKRKGPQRDGQAFDFPSAKTL